MWHTSYNIKTLIFLALQVLLHFILWENVDKKLICMLPPPPEDKYLCQLKNTFLCVIGSVPVKVTLSKKACVTFYLNTRCQPYTHHHLPCSYCISWHCTWTDRFTRQTTVHACLSLTWHVDSCLTVSHFHILLLVFLCSISLSWQASTCVLRPPESSC